MRMLFSHDRAMSTRIHRKPAHLSPKELEDRQVRELIEGIKRRLAAIEAKATLLASRYTVILQQGDGWWEIRVVEVPACIVKGETLEETAVLMARKLSDELSKVMK